MLTKVYLFHPKTKEKQGEKKAKFRKDFHQNPGDMGKFEKTQPPSSPK